MMKKRKKNYKIRMQFLIIHNFISFRYFRCPPNKRQNYLKSSIASPFKCPWPQLLREWCTASDSAEQQFYLLRDKNKLHEVEQFLAGKGGNVKNFDENCLIPVSISLSGRGNVNKYAIICLPKKQDIRENGKNRANFTLKPIVTEPIAKDTNEVQRKQLRLNHLMMLKRLRRRRVRVKRKQQEYSERKVIIAPSRTTNLINAQYNAMCELWLPKVPKTIRHQCSREVFGYATQCQFMFHEAKVAGIGYVTMNGLRKLVKSNIGRKLNQVIVRDPNSLNYHLATISIR